MPPKGDKSEKPATAQVIISLECVPESTETLTVQQNVLVTQVRVCLRACACV